jgi:hypothetical protein
MLSKIKQFMLFTRHLSKILIGEREKKKCLNMSLKWLKLMYEHYNDIKHACPKDTPPKKG